MSPPSTAPAAPVICPCCSQTIPTPFRCEACGGTFMPIKAAQRFCCKACSKAQWRRVKNNVKGLTNPYLRKPRSPKALEAAQVCREEKQESLFEPAPIRTTAHDTDIDSCFAEIMAEAEAEEIVDGLHVIELPPEDTIARPYAVTPVLPPPGRTGSSPRRLCQRNAKQARLHSAGIFTARRPSLRSIILNPLRSNPAIPS